ncbi:threonine dehydratase, partial [Burkholderia multivorans]|uniref:pyridoxal-phosphate dependent enzyme n=1 Tax=Burkholderia multivorans TaxID=87883 RepID=UPI000DB26DD0
FVPRTTPKQKVERIRHFGGEWATIEISGSTYDDASALAHRFADRNDALLVSAFDDRRTIAGQGTVAVDIAGQLETHPDAIIVPVGGGGVIAGIAAYAAEHMPNTKIIGA